MAAPHAHSPSPAHSHARSHPRYLARRSSLLTVSAIAAALAGGGVVYAASQPAIHTSTPLSERQITNMDELRQQIRNYYGDPLGTGKASEDGNYSREARSVAAAGLRWLAAPHHHAQGKKAVVLDVDDTALLTWNYEIASNWTFDPVTSAKYVTGQRFPPVFGMVDLARNAVQEGYAIFFITGRPASQEAATRGNLLSDGIGVDAGYPTPTTLPNGEDGLFTKPAVADYPDYLETACATDPNGSCTTTHYKSATRAHIESLGYDIVADFGDQHSDLAGGHADGTFKMPNPNYYLP